MHTRSESAAIRTASAALWREVDMTEVCMNEEIANVKHEYVLLVWCHLNYLFISYRIQME
jgi:hypothetical protein